MTMLFVLLVSFSIQIATSTSCEDYLGYCHYDTDCCDIDVICLSHLCVPGYRTTPPTSVSGCSYHDLVSRVEPDLPDSLVTCHDITGKKIDQTSDDLIMAPETTCCIYSSGHLDLEFFCDSLENFHFWVVK